jgi:hypothetical protein
MFIIYTVKKNQEKISFFFFFFSPLKKREKNKKINKEMLNLKEKIDYKELIQSE